jgi:hypothetical protein
LKGPDVCLWHIPAVCCGAASRPVSEGNRTVCPRLKAQLKADADRFAKNAAPVIREIQSSGVASHRGIARALNARRIATARGLRRVATVLL